MTIRTPFSFDDLNEKAAPHFRVLAHRLELAHNAGRTQSLLKPFEGFRSLKHQQAAFERKTSKDRPWQSAHQYGLAVDFVPYHPVTKWHWPSADHPDWGELRAIARNLGLHCELDWDRPHVEHPIWHQIKRHVV